MIFTLCDFFGVLVFLAINRISRKLEPSEKDDFSFDETIISISKFSTKSFRRFVNDSIRRMVAGNTNASFPPSFRNSFASRTKYACSPNFLSIIFSYFLNRSETRAFSFLEINS